ncbi:MAG TPA: TrkH family potassium uptake protein [Candidatus Eisenbergiella merdavium]|uniref:TrkH family potassium uptake protein n=1 Tax=Candidatus Eisenbergiella merdavium TaxID=2838551 RepID=A0A9D2NIN8_9FIRM|nr:TrkH family potassium uptake protein [Candidatus Eisenbergiella merdavium]
MNYRSITYILGWIMRVEGAFLFLPVIVALIYGEEVWTVYLASAVLTLAAGTLLSRKRGENFQLYAREGYVAVALGWIFMSLIGAVPLWLTGDIPRFVDALFEIISGFTTTGSSILSDVEALSRGGMFWRCFSHWIGGMGVLVFLLQIIPLSSGQTMYLMRAESPGPSVSKLVPKVRKTAFVLYGIYIGMTVLEILFLLLGRMPLYDTLCITFGTAGTGGFAVYSDSMAGYGPYLQIVVTVFMFLFGVNFSFYYLLLTKRVKEAFQIEEVRAYFALFAASSVLIALNLLPQLGNLADSLRHAAFQVSSIMTTTGFATVDFDKWPEFSRMLLVLLMFVGACAGSTGGGIKVSRVLMYTKTIKKELAFLVHPRSVKVILMDGKKMEHTVVRAANIFLITYLGILAVSVLLVSLDGKDFTTTVTAVITALNNVGPGLSLVGPMGNFGFFSDFSKIVLMFDMLAGRLEIFPLLLLFVPYTWKK